jgi:YVTN family beta-propeller protein
MPRFGDRWSVARWRRATVLAAAAVAAAAALAGADPGVAATVSSGSVPAAYTVTRFPTGKITYGAALDTANGSVYAQSPGGVLQVLNASTGQVTSTLAVPARGYAIAADPATDRVYVGAGSGSQNSVTVVDGATNSVIATITLPGYPMSIAVDPVSDTIYAVGGPGLMVIDGATDTMTGTIAIGGGPHAVAVDPATGKVYVTQPNTGTVAVIDASTGAVTAAAQTADMPEGIAVDPATDTIYTANQFQSVSVIDGATNTVTKSIDLRPEQVVGEGIAVDPASGTLVVTNSNGWLGYTAIINAATGAVTDSLSRGGDSVAIDPATGDIYESSRAGGIWRLMPGSVNQKCPILRDHIATFDIGVHSSWTMPTDAAPAAAFSETGALPAGITISPSGLIGGTPAPGTAGTYPVQVTLTNGVAPNDTSTLTIGVYPTPAISSPNHATFTAGTAGGFTMQATGQPALTITQAGALPAGLTFFSGAPNNSGFLSGTPGRGTGGTYKLTFTASDTLATTTQPFTLTVDEAPSFTSPSTVTFRAGQTNSFTIRTLGFPADRITEQGTLPVGVTFRANSNGTATLSGKPLLRARGRTFRLNLTASNGIGAAAHQVLTLSIR